MLAAHLTPALGTPLRAEIEQVDVRASTVPDETPDHHPTGYRGSVGKLYTAVSSELSSNWWLPMRIARCVLFKIFAAFFADSFDAYAP